MSACPFCEFEKSRVVLSSASAFAIRDTFPVAKGHTLVIPRLHVKSPYDLSIEDQDAVWHLVSRVRQKCKEDFGVHVIPRRQGDVPDPRGGIRNIIPARARYWETD
jgi:diadenosine tetraphosphate (Ap4A) HIT family hydrolase